MEANSKNFSILVENEEQFNRVWNYVRWYLPDYNDLRYNESKPIGVYFCPSDNGLQARVFRSISTYDLVKNISITWEQFLEYEKEIIKIPLPNDYIDMSNVKIDERFAPSVFDNLPLDVPQQIANTIRELNQLTPKLSNDNGLEVIFNSGGEGDVTLALDNLTKFTSVKSIFGGEELL